MWIEDVNAGRRRGLIALDLDGTMLDATSRVSAATASAVKRAMAQGWSVCIATGRTWWESRFAVEACGLIGPGAFVNGATICSMTSGEMIGSTRMPGPLACELARVIEGVGLPAMMLLESGGQSAEYRISSGVPVPAALSDWIDAHRNDVAMVADLATKPRDRVLRVGTVAQPESVAKLDHWVAHHHADECVWQTMHVPSYGVNVFEVFAAGVNKWHGVIELCKELDVDPKHTVAVGDDINDVPMLRQAGLGVAMGNATQFARDATTRIIGSNREEGLATFIDELLAGRVKV
jgi:Cof subfamily protein (haloacid dehalogenase superfamily)